MSNVGRAKALLTELAARGLRDVCVCAGARNAPFVAALERARGLTALSFFEERSAGFFALGRARRDHRPVAVAVTSGTAAAELLPATIEAHYSGVPLVLLTSDRPRRLRGTGAPQAIEQVGLYGRFVETECDLEGDDPLRLTEWTGRGPLHLNVCFDEPLIDEPVEAWSVLAGAEASTVGSKVVDETVGALAGVSRALLRARHPIVIVGGLDAEAERVAVRGLLLKLGAPVYAESTSGLREDPVLDSLLLKSGDRILSWAMARGHFDCVLRVGGVPTARLWRDLEAPSCPIPVVSISRLSFKGLSRCEHAWGDLAALADHLAKVIEPRPGSPELFACDAGRARALERLLAEHPCSEPSLTCALSLVMAGSATVYLGNSLPIREWDLAAVRGRPRWAQASRGANGIDGQISTFLGGVREGREAWAVVGDLTALYDLAAPWALPYVANACARVVVMNNGGGKIFSRLFGNPLFENRHSLRFDHFAKAWGLEYERWAEIPPDGARSTGAALLEVVPDPAETAAFWSGHDELWRKP